MRFLIRLIRILHSVHLYCNGAFERSVVYGRCDGTSDYQSNGHPHWKFRIGGLVYARHFHENVCLVQAEFALPVINTDFSDCCITITMNNEHS